MGNQQAKVSDIIWLSGFTDGEGCFTFKGGFQDGGFYYYPSWIIANTDMHTLECVKEILDDIGVGYNVSLRRRKNPNWKPSWCVIIQGFKRLDKFLPVIEPYLKTKSEQCKKMRAWIQLRRNHTYNLGNNNASTRHQKQAGRKAATVPYSEQELQLITEVKSYNAIGGRKPSHLLAPQTKRFPNNS